MSGSTRWCSSPPDRPGRRGASDINVAEQRYLMTVLATAANARFSVSRMEIDRVGPTYTVDTLRALRSSLSDTELYFITGADAILNILTWKDAAEALEMASFVAATRPGYDLAAAGAARPDATGDPARRARPGHLLQRHPRTLQRRPVGALPDPREVEEFARKHGLYGTIGHGLAAADVRGR